MWGLFFLCIFVSNNKDMDFNSLLIKSYTNEELSNVANNPQDYLLGHAQACRAELARRNLLKQ